MILSVGSCNSLQIHFDCFRSMTVLLELLTAVFNRPLQVIL